MSIKVFTLIDAPIARQIRVARTLKGWRQSDLAFFATQLLRQVMRDESLRVTPENIVRIEGGSAIHEDRKRAVLACLGIDDD